MVNSSDNEFAVEVTGLVVIRSGQTILDSLNLNVRRGSITGLLGPSGCGKTTALRTLAGVQRYGGTARVLGLPAGHRALRPRIGYVTQSESVYPDLSAIENVRYFAALYGRPRGAAAKALESVDLTSKSNSRVRDLSGGQQSRVSLACALVADPELIILDEPTVGLDPVLRVKLWRQFRKLASAGTTLLISSHVMDEADHCDEILLMRSGQLIGHGTPDQLRERAREIHPTSGALSMEDVFLALVSRDQRSDVA